MRHLKKREYRVSEKNLYKYNLPETPEKHYWKLWDVSIAGYAPLAFLELVKKTWYGRKVIADKYIVSINEKTMFGKVQQEAEDLLKLNRINKRKQ